MQTFLFFQIAFLNIINLILDISATPTVTPASVFVVEGSEVTLTCIISEEAEAIISWRSNTRSFTVQQTNGSECKFGGNILTDIIIGCPMNRTFSLTIRNISGSYINDTWRCLSIENGFLFFSNNVTIQKLGN